MKSMREDDNKVSLLLHHLVHGDPMPTRSRSIYFTTYVVAELDNLIVLILNLDVGQFGSRDSIEKV